MDFGRPNAEIGQKMADGRLLFLALYMYVIIINLAGLVRPDLCLSTENYLACKTYSGVAWYRQCRIVQCQVYLVSSSAEMTHT